MHTDKLIVCLFVALVLGAGIFAHINQDLRLQIARAEEARLDAAGVIGWIDLDPATKQIVFVGR
mgnify:CR=1 FL=1